MLVTIEGEPGSGAQQVFFSSVRRGTVLLLLRLPYTCTHVSVEAGRGRQNRVPGPTVDNRSRTILNLEVLAPIAATCFGLIARRRIVSTP